MRRSAGRSSFCRSVIQVHGFSATLAGSAFLPFTAIMAVLSRWSGGLIDRFGARLPLVIGPVIAACGFALLAMADMAGSFLTLVAPMVVLGVGMTITVAPLTTSVINAVPQRQAGTASGINNAVASLASLLAVALFGAIALGTYNRALDRELMSPSLSAQVRQAVAQARGKFAAELTLQGEDRKVAQEVVRRSLGRQHLAGAVTAAVLAPLSALRAAPTIRPKPKPAADRALCRARLHPRPRGPSLILEGIDLVLLDHGQADIVEAVEQAGRKASTSNFTTPPSGPRISCCRDRSRASRWRCGRRRRTASRDLRARPGSAGCRS
jgi:hypothetical protein